MGANRKQGWCLFALLLGFVMVPAGIVGYAEAKATFWGVLAFAAGAVLILGAGIGFTVLKPREHEGEENGPGTLAPEGRAEALVKGGPGV